jgi:hypothetical protein
VRDVYYLYIAGSGPFCARRPLASHFVLEKALDFPGPSLPGRHRRVGSVTAAVTAAGHPHHEMLIILQRQRAIDRHAGGLPYHAQLISCDLVRSLGETDRQVEEVNVDHRPAPRTAHGRRPPSPRPHVDRDIRAATDGNIQLSPENVRHRLGPALTAPQRSPVPDRLDRVQATGPRTVAVTGNRDLDTPRSPVPDHRGQAARQVSQRRLRTLAYLSRALPEPDLQRAGDLIDQPCRQRSTGSRIRHRNWPLAGPGHPGSDLIQR